VSIRYTLRLVENGAEVWKRWTGDREEAKGIALTGLVQVEAPRRAAEMLLTGLATAEPSGESFYETVAYSPDLTSSLHLTIRSTTPKG
jgi:hypothetical protein